ncbi:MAG: hypothetical protein IKT14_07900 [Clostridiales bacterium]|nr:hypothetical protein [Clostridiales bacterium]
MKKISVLALIMAILVFACFAVSCSKAEPSVSETTLPDIANIELPDYASTMQMINEYEISYAEFMNNATEKVNRTETSGTTLLGNTCNARYTVTETGMYKNVALEVTRDNLLMYDEYFALDDTTMFVARSYLDADNKPHIEKYVSVNGILFFIDEEAQTFTPVIDAAANDFYSDFSQVEELYAP